MKCIGFDTSNYTTSVASFSEGKQINIGKLLPVPESAKGLRQSDALFHHIRALPDLTSELIHSVGCGADAVAVSVSPRRAEGSYMPCFLAGHTVAHTLAKGLGVELYIFSHQEGHLAAAAYSANSQVIFHTPFLAWHLSGGTTELLHCVPSDDLPFRVECIGGTRDISAGQCVDRAGVALGLQFPCGIALEKLSLE
ncbi:MAG: DNA-binding protein, partial [Ruminococcaceae bacterium]|nr:DNA-binding protein [Oscillospiraceae bacterium]